jgi:phenylpyruvate tautomerase PptA (4-oxalocrotonate tautomerase family)
MPIVDVKVIATAETVLPKGTAKVLAEAIAAVLKAPEGRVWVRLEMLAEHLYAENGITEQVHPVFLTILHADLPPPEVLAAQSIALTNAAAKCLGRNPERVHIEYAPSGRGRVAFGGKLLQ